MKQGDRCEIIDTPIGINKNKIGRKGVILAIDNFDNDDYDVSFKDEFGSIWWLNKSHLKLIQDENETRR